MTTKPIRISMETIAMVEDFRKTLRENRKAPETIRVLANMDNSSIVDFLVRSAIEHFMATIGK